MSNWSIYGHTTEKIHHNLPDSGQHRNPPLKLNHRNFHNRSQKQIQNGQPHKKDNFLRQGAGVVGAVYLNKQPRRNKWQLLKIL